jgi:DsbC/DsbD-like thiol-disulfide interchange protein
MSMASARRVAIAALLVALPRLAEPQAARPRATVQLRETEAQARAGGSVALVLDVTLPPEVHVQAHEPDDPLLIPTEVSLDVPDGITVQSLTYPEPSELTQAGRDKPLLVLGPSFEIGVRLGVGTEVTPGVRTVPVVLRYQACNDSVCFPPARATAAWTLRVER